MITEKQTIGTCSKCGGPVNKAPRLLDKAPRLLDKDSGLLGSDPFCRRMARLAICATSAGRP